MDHKIKLILGLSFVVLVLLMFIGANAYSQKQTRVYNQGLQDGVLLQQKNVLETVQATGFYSLNVVDENGQQARVILRPVQPAQQQTQQ